MATVAEVISFLEQIAPPALQESYDNAGLICGDRNTAVSSVLVSLDAIETVVDEAIEVGANLVISHHPIVFGGLKSLTGANYVERTVIKAIKNDIALFAVHTNLDNVLSHGVNQKLAQELHLEKIRVLSPRPDVGHFVIHVPTLLKEEVLTALRNEMGSMIQSFGIQIEADEKIHVTGPLFLSRIIAGVCDHYQTAYWEHKMKSSDATQIGSGLVGELKLPMTEEDFLEFVKERLNLKVIRHTALLGRSVQRVAICGGSGSFLLPAAIKSNADVFITADYKYHQFFDADEELVIADVGHFESEQFTINLLADLINGKFSNFAARCAKTPTNPVHYFI